jgi:DAACS family dicarboxylate/amino acid:cation (Na+ or H+) symporter
MERERRKMPLHVKILIGLLVGAVAGIICQWQLGDDPRVDDFARGYALPFGRLFLRMIFMVVVPLLFSALALGVLEMGAGKRVGRVGVISLLMTLLLSGIAVLIAYGAFTAFQPGSGLTPEKRDQLMQAYGDPTKAKENVTQAEGRKTVPEMILEIVPENPIAEANRALQGGLLPLMFFALVFGLAMAAIGPTPTMLSMRAFLEGLFAISQKMIEFAMMLAPFGVAALLFNTTFVLGIDAIAALGKYMIVVLAALAFHLFIVYGIVLKVIARRNPVEFFRQVKTVMLTAFATSSSNATLPTALKSAEEDVKLPKDISSFVLTIGATANQNGTALFEGITILFLANLFGADLTVADQFGVLGLAIVAGIGTAGVPGGAWPMIAVILGMYGVDPGSIGLVIGVDRILDMSRTVLNVTGDMTIAASVTSIEERVGGAGRQPVLTQETDV